MDSRRNFLRGMARAATPGRPSEPRPRRDPVQPPAAAHLAEPDRHSAARAAPEWGDERQARISGAEVLVIGAGALAGPVLAYLAGAGVSRLGVVDDALVAPGDLRADLLHFTPDVGYAKAHSAAVKLGFLNPDVVVEPYQVHLDAANADGLLAGQHMVVDGSNSEKTNAIVAAACHRLGVALVTAGAGSRSGWVLAVAAGLRACPRCAGDDVPAAGTFVPGPLAGMVGALMADEALTLLGEAGPAGGRLVRVDLSGPALSAAPWHPRPDCPHSDDR